MFVSLPTLTTRRDAAARPRARRAPCAKLPGDVRERAQGLAGATSPGITTYRETRNAYLEVASQLKLATGHYNKRTHLSARDAYVAATATYTKCLYE